jgi:hypothetical protein
MKGWRFSLAIVASGIAALLHAAAAFAGAVVADVEGEVRVEVAGAKSRALIPGQRLDSGNLVTAGGGSRVLLHFDDGQWAALHENTALHIEDYRFQPQAPAADRAVFVLLRGALRIVTGALGRRNPEAFELRTPDLNIGIRGTDFLVAIQNRSYLSVLEGRVAATNAGGSVTFGAGDFAAAAETSMPAAAIQANALPAAVSSAFGSLGALRMAPPAPSGAAGNAAPAEDARARELRDSLGRDQGRDASGAARERARDLKPRPK